MILSEHYVRAIRHKIGAAEISAPIRQSVPEAAAEVIAAYMEAAA